MFLESSPFHRLCEYTRTQNGCKPLRPSKRTRVHDLHRFNLEVKMNATTPMFSDGAPAPGDRLSILIYVSNYDVLGSPVFDNDTTCWALRSLLSGLASAAVGTPVQCEHVGSGHFFLPAGDAVRCDADLTADIQRRIARHAAATFPIRSSVTIVRTPFDRSAVAFPSTLLF